MADLGTAATFLPGNGEGRVALYRKIQTASRMTACDSCGGSVEVGEQYLRVQMAVERKGEDLADREQAREVDYRRRVILKFHTDCEPTSTPSVPLHLQASTPGRVWVAAEVLDYFVLNGSWRWARCITLDGRIFDAALEMIKVVQR